jgi:hypothetical protein
MSALASYAAADGMATGQVRQALKALGIRQIFGPPRPKRAGAASVPSRPFRGAPRRGCGRRASHLRGSQRLIHPALRARIQSPLNRGAGRDGQRLRAAGCARPRAPALDPARTHGRQRQHGESQWGGPAATAHPAPPALRALSGVVHELPEGMRAISYQGQLWRATAPPATCAPSSAHSVAARPPVGHTARPPGSRRVPPAHPQHRSTERTSVTANDPGHD